jgi:hypothetical protein
MMLVNRVVVTLAVGTALALAHPSAAQYQVASADGKSSLRFGVLSQLQAEWIDTQGLSQATQNLFVRRVRLMVGGKLGDRLSLFFETDSPNLGKAAADGSKNEGTIFVQDLVVTYSFSQALKLDAGILLVPLAYHSGQGATSLLALDYSPYAFLPSTPTKSRVGRDYGAQARGYLFGQHLEYRAGVGQGVRGTAAGNPFRTYGRVVYYPFESQNELFYTGTTHGKRKLLGFGGSFDRQKEYSTIGADVFFDRSIGHGNAVTAQVDYWHIDGGTFLTDLPKQDVWAAEAGVYLGFARLEPFVQFSHRGYSDAKLPTESCTQLGVAYWIDGHKANVKLGVASVKKDGSPDRTQVTGQLQLLLW